MRKFFSINLFTVLAICLLATACGNKESNQESSKAKISGIIARADSMLPNYRFVDVDTVFVYYNLAKDYNDEMLRLQANYENEVKRHQNSIQSFATNVDKKRQNNGYLSEQSLNADLQQLATMQDNAQKAVANLQNNILLADQQGRQTVTDSILAFINEYNLSKGYDAIFIKSVTLCSNPALDITAEVIEGLNARYNKVK
ncbi:MAG: OmpH family outer membrane protein [Muribaculaceae bacterium]|nr:OmpH family outer membrane protein [Muribaculaceae bacterium]